VHGHEQDKVYPEQNTIMYWNETPNDQKP